MVGKNSRHRRTSGAILVEGVVALGLLIFGAVVGTLLLANTGLSVFYKEKLGFVTNQAALLATSFKDDDPDIERKVREKTDDLLTLMGLPKAKEIKVNNSPSIVSVEVQLENLPLMGDGSVLPVNISLRDVGAALRGTGNGGLNAEGFLIVGPSPGNASGGSGGGAIGAIVPIVAYTGFAGTPRGDSRTNIESVNAINKSKKPIEQLSVALTNLNTHTGTVLLVQDKKVPGLGN